jgi:hypothetical protein
MSHSTEQGGQNPVLKSTPHLRVFLLSMSVIDIGTVLNKLDDTVDEQLNTVKQYGLQFITADGRLRTMLCRKNVKSPKQQLAKPLQKRGRVLWNLQRHGTMFVQDLDLNQARAVKVATICGFTSSPESNTYLRVFH